MIVTLDFECFFSKDYSLKKLTTEEYVRDPRFKVHGCAIKLDADPAFWVYGRDLWQYGPMIEDAAALAHHAQFDGLILSHHFGIKPALWLDTLSMARIAVPHERHSLDHLSKYFGLPGKQHQALANVMGVRDPSAEQLAALGQMSCDDADKTYTIFTKIRDYIPRNELLVIDQTIRMFTEPRLTLDRQGLEKYHAEVVAKKEDALNSLGLSREALQSAEQFADILRSLGVDPPTKPSPTGNGDIYAFAKTDAGMRELLEHDDERVAAVASARLGIKSTIDETRCERLLSMDRRGPLCVYLRYAGAHTTRWSGGDQLNWQNFRRLEVDGSPGRIRSAITAPKGYHIVVADSSQIECRLLNWFAGQDDVIEKFRNKEDPYVGVASQFYGREITKADKAERGTGKQLELSCGYGAGAQTIVQTARLGIYGPPVNLTLDDGYRARDIYRGTHPAVVALWKEAEQYFQILESGGEAQWGCVDVSERAVWGPNGLPMWYTDHKSEGDERYIRVRGMWRKFYGAKLVENLIQFLARVVISQAMLKITKETGERAVNTTHDELMYLVPEQDAEKFLDYVLSVLRMTPEWAPGLPLDAEGLHGERYSK